jgi:hypothetical protein
VVTESRLCRVTGFEISFGVMRASRRKVREHRAPCRHLAVASNYVIMDIMVRLKQEGG